MLEEVLSRIELIIACEGSRKISQENLEFLFDKYQLSEEERETVLGSCKEKRIAIFRESTDADKAKVIEEAQQVKGEKKPEKKGFFSRLFGR